MVDLAVIRRPAIAWGLWLQALAVATYYALLLFTVALYVQGGHSALVSGLTLVPWVAAFGIPGRLLARLPARAQPMLPATGCLILALAYAAISASMLTEHHPAALLLVLLAADISGVFTTVRQIAGAIGVAAFGTLYLSQLGRPGAAGATHAFGIVTAAFAGVALIAAATGYRATHLPVPHVDR